MKILITDKQLRIIKEQIKNPVPKPYTTSRDNTSTKMDKQPYVSPEQMAKNKSEYTKKREEEIRSGKSSERFLGMFDVPVTYGEIERQNAPTIARKKVAAEIVQGKVYKNIAEILLDVPLAGLGEMFKIIKFTPQELETLKKISSVGEKSTPQQENLSKIIFVNAVKRAKPQFVEKYGKDGYETLTYELLNNKQVTKDEFLKYINLEKKFVEPDLSVIKGVKISSEEIKKIDGLGEMFKKSKYEDLKGKVFEIKINLTSDKRNMDYLPVAKVKVVENIPNGTQGFKRSVYNSEKGSYELHVTISYDFIKKNSKEAVSELITHEIVHAKDVTSDYRKYQTVHYEDVVDPKTNRKLSELPSHSKEYKELYQKYLNDYWNKYYINTTEKIARESAFFKTVTTKSADLLKSKKYTKEQILSAIDEIINFTKSPTQKTLYDQQTISKILSDKVTGLMNKTEKSMIRNLFNYKWSNPALEILSYKGPAAIDSNMDYMWALSTFGTKDEYLKFLRNLSIQLDHVKRQLKRF